MSALTLGIVLLAGFFQGTFGLGMRKFAPLAWEAYWLIFTIAGMIVIPATWAAATVPHPFGAVGAVPVSLVLRVMAYGAGWGIGATMFGLAINYVGMSLSNGIALGLGAVMGSLVPIVQKGNVVFDHATLLVLLGNLVMVIGVAIVTAAGIDRDRIQAARGKPIIGIQTGRLFWLGLFFCLASGVACAMLNIGTVAGEPIARAAVQLGDSLAPEARQALERGASVLPWVVIFWGGAIVNLIYATFFLLKKKSYQTFRMQGAAKGALWAIGTAVLWFFALALYGQGAAMMGRLGAVIGWTMFMALALIISNAWGIFTGEWNGSRRPLVVMLAGNAVLVASTILLGYVHSLSLGSP
jgi:L-rhamnose-H+ transport protein